MMKYIRNFNSINSATSDEKLLSPSLTLVKNEDSQQRIMHKKTYKDDSLKLGGTTLPTLYWVDYLTFTCIENGGISLTNYNDNTPIIEYSKNNGEWATWNYLNISLKSGDIIKLRGNNHVGFNSSDKYSKFSMSGKIATSGSVMSLLTDDNDNISIPCQHCFRHLFYQCESLITAPELPATTLKDCCYQYMFFNCYKLNYIKCLAITGINENNSTDAWLANNSISDGTFVKASSATWPTGISGIPDGWTVQTV